MPDLFFYRDPEEAEKEEKERWVEVFKLILSTFLGRLDRQCFSLSNQCAR